jgi:hypothetical protein
VIALVDQVQPKAAAEKPSTTVMAATIEKRTDIE